MGLLKPQAGFPSLPFSTKMKQNWIKKGQNVRRSKWQKWHIRYQELTHVTLPPRKDNVPSFGTTLTDEGLRDLAYNGPNTKNPTTMVDQAIAVKYLEFQLWYKPSLTKKNKISNLIRMIIDEENQQINQKQTLSTVQNTQEHTQNKTWSEHSLM